MTSWCPQAREEQARARKLEEEKSDMALRLRRREQELSEATDAVSAATRTS